MASGITYNIAGKYNPKGEKDAIKGIQKLTSVAKKFNLAVGGFVISKVFQGISKVVSGSTEEFIKNDKAIKNLSVSLNNNVKLSEGALDRLQKKMDEVSEGGIFGGDELANATALASQMGLNEEAINKVLDASTEMASSGVMPLEQAVKNLSATYGGNLGQLQKLYPELKNLTKEELEQGKAVDILKGKYDGFRETLGSTFEGQDIKFQDAFGNLQEKLGGVLSGLKFGMEGKMMEPLNKVAEWIDTNKVNILKFFYNMPQLASVSIKTIYELIKKTFTSEGMSNIISYLGSSTINAFKYALPTIFEAFKTVFTSIVDLLDFLVGNQIRKLQDKLSELGNFLIEKINTLVSKAMENPIVKWLYEFFSKNKADEFEAITFRFDTNRSAKNKTWEETKNNISNKFDNLITLYKKNFKEGNKAQLDAMREFASFYSDITEGASKEFKEALNKKLPEDLVQAMENANISVNNEGEEVEESGNTNTETNTSNDPINYLEQFKETAFNALGEIGSFLKNIFDSSFNPILFLIELVGKFINSLAQSAPAFNTFINGITYIINIIASTIAPLVNNIFLPLVNVLRNVGIMIGNLLIPVFNILSKLLQPVFELVSVLVQTLKPFIDIFVMLLNLLVEFDPVLTLIGDTVRFISDLITTVYNNIIRPVLNGVMWVFAKVGNFFIGLYNQIVDVLRSIKIFKWRPFEDMQRANELNYSKMELKEIATDDYKNHREELETGEVPKFEYNPENYQSDTLIPVEVPEYENIEIPSNNNGYNSTSGRSASYTAPKDIIFNIDIGNLVGSDGMREFSLMIRDEIKEAEALGR